MTDLRNLIDRLDADLSEVRSEDGPRGQRLSDFQQAASDLEEKVVEAFQAALKLKGMWDEHEEIHPKQRKMYDMVVDMMSDIAKARNPAATVKMGLRRMR